MTFHPVHFLHVENFMELLQNCLVDLIMKLCAWSVISEEKFCSVSVSCFLLKAFGQWAVDLVVVLILALNSSLDLQVQVNRLVEIVNPCKSN